MPPGFRPRGENVRKQNVKTFGKGGGVVRIFSFGNIVGEGGKARGGYLQGKGKVFEK